MAAKEGRAKSAMGGGKKSKSSSGKKSKGHKVHEMHIRHAKSGGYIVKHDFKADQAGGMSPEPEEHAVPDMDQLQQHVDAHMQPPPAEEEPQPMGGGAAASGPGGPGAAMGM